MTQAASTINFAITFSAASPFCANPSTLAAAHPVLHQLQYSKPVGELSDVLVFALPTSHQETRDEAVRALKSLEGVLRVDVLQGRTRAKRDEF